MHLIAYLSDYTSQDEAVDEVLNDIVTAAKKENHVHGVTGVLFFHDSKFLQVIEGAESDLRQLMVNIEADNRHQNVQYIIDTPIENRSFSEWKMDSFHLGVGRKFDVETIKLLTDKFQATLLPRADSLIFYYRALLQEAQPTC